MNMERRTKTGGWGTEDRGRTASWSGKGRRGMDIRRHWFEAVDGNSVLAIAELEREKGWRAGKDGVRAVIGRGKGWASINLT